jgi:hypothetical protein
LNKIENKPLVPSGESESNEPSKQKRQDEKSRDKETGSKISRKILIQQQSNEPQPSGPLQNSGKHRHDSRSFRGSACRPEVRNRNEQVKEKEQAEVSDEKPGEYRSEGNDQRPQNPSSAADKSNDHRSHSKPQNPHATDKSNEHHSSDKSSELQGKVEKKLDHHRSSDRSSGHDSGKRLNENSPVVVEHEPENKSDKVLDSIPASQHHQKVERIEQEAGSGYEEGNVYWYLLYVFDIL